MRRTGMFLLLAAFAIAIPLTEASAQSARRGAVVGGATGAVIGGIAGGGRGALLGGGIGALTGAVVGDQMQRRRNNFYWHNNRCWQRTRANEFFPVSNRYCR